MKTRYFVDWIAATVPTIDATIGDAIDIGTQLLPHTAGKWVIIKPRNGYKNAARAPEGWCVMCGRSDMGVHIIMPGSALTGLPAASFQARGLIDNLVRGSASFARIDLALDAVDSRLNIAQLKQALDRNEAQTEARRNSLITSGVDGFCLYVGGRQSDRFMRVYNKAAQLRGMGHIPECDDWIRVEIELKGAQAQTAAHILSVEPEIGKLIRTVILAHCDFPFVSPWIRIMRGSTMTIGPSIRRIGNVRRWLLSACATALARELVADPLFKAEFEKSVASAIEQFRAQSVNNI